MCQRRSSLFFSWLSSTKSMIWSMVEYKLLHWSQKELWFSKLQCLSLYKFGLVVSSKAKEIQCDAQVEWSTQCWGYSILTYCFPLSRLSRIPLFPAKCFFTISAKILKPFSPFVVVLSSPANDFCWDGFNFFRILYRELSDNDS